MDVEQQQGTWTQMSLFERVEGSVRPGASGEGGTGPAAYEEWQASTALNRERALTSDLMERISERGNLNRAYKRVKANKGAPGIDGMTVEELYDWLKEHKEGLIASLLDGSYEPQTVLGREIDKPGGGKRRLGIPTVVDRLVQQAILQELEGIVDPIFSESSYGFRRGRNAHQAVKRAAEYVAEGRAIVVDIDLEKFFDRVNHDILMARLARWVSDKRLLRIGPALSGSGDDVGRRVYRALRRDTAGRTTVAVAGESSVRRLGQGTGATRALLLPLRGRLQHLRSDTAGRGTGNSLGDSVSGGKTPLTGELGEERGGLCRRAAVSGIPAAARWAIRDCVPEPGAGQEADTGDYTTQPRSQHRADDPRTELVSDGVGDILSLCGVQDTPTTSGRVDTTETSLRTAQTTEKS